METARPHRWRDVALAVTRDLGDLVIAFERAARNKQAEVAAARAKASLDRARERYIGQKREINEAELRAGESGPDRELSRVRSANLSRSLEGLERDLELASARNAVLELGSNLEDQGLGLTFETVDRGDIPRSAELDANDLLLLGALTFLFGFPLAALAVGAFSSPIVNTEDLRNLDLPLLAEVRGLKLKARRGA